MEIFDRGDVLITCGLNWQPNLGNMGRLYELQKLIGLRLVTTCYDLIPIMFTHFVPGMEKTFSPTCWTWFVTPITFFAFHAAPGEICCAG